MIYIGADHRGFELKNRLAKRLQDQGYKITDLGDTRFDSNDDYVDFAQKVAEATVGMDDNKGILLCGSGVGVDMVANKVPGVRSALVANPAQAIQARQHEDANVISLPADQLDEEAAWEIVLSFITTPFSQEPRHIRRLNKMTKIEESYEN